MTKILALMGKSGTGKDTVARHLAQLYPERVNNIVSYTSRPAREGEEYGKDYFFVSHNTFDELITLGQMVEYTFFNSWGYGTPVDSLSKEKVNVGVFNPGGVRQLLYRATDLDIEVYPIYLRVGDKERLLRQLNREESPNVDEVIRRFSADNKDFADLSDIEECPRFMTFYNNTTEDFGEILRVLGTYL